ncbi:MAG: hypothetical protein B6A08_06650 [Sorangiineae bacterium NIC37A_2]|nr:MAG: hypothetical protein B6A08_06650 [Sorangiineae bacterium NIC37A_2]
MRRRDQPSAAERTGCLARHPVAPAALPAAFRLALRSGPALEAASSMLVVALAGGVCERRFTGAPLDRSLLTCGDGKKTSTLHDHA